jgi:hypothetical protein
MNKKTTFGHGLTAVPSGLPEDRPQFNLSSHFNVIKKESQYKDEDPNERIQREGVEYWGGGQADQALLGGEYEWYLKHKGYSDKL